MTKREQNVEWLLSTAEKAGLTIGMIDPYIRLAQSLFPTASEATIRSYARTVLRLRRLKRNQSSKEAGL